MYHISKGCLCSSKGAPVPRHNAQWPVQVYAIGPKSRMSMSYEDPLWTNEISWISASSTKSLESDERDFEIVWLQEKDSLNIRCEHFSLLTFYNVLCLKGRLCLLAGVGKMRNCGMRKVKCGIENAERR